MTSWHENAFHIIDLLWGEFTVQQWIPHTKGQSTDKGPVIRKADVSFLASLNKLLSKQFRHE